MKKALVILSTLAVLLGGCGVNKEEANQTHAREEQKAPNEMDSKDLPQVTAFQDEATREYMVSTKEVEPGYYLLESKTKRFRMLFPDKGKVIMSRSSYISENEENIGFNSYDEDNNILFDGKVTYYKGHSFAQDTEVMLEIISGKNDYTGEYHNEENNNNNIYLASKKYTFTNIDRKYNFIYGYFGFVKFKEEEDEGIEFSFSYSCKDDDKACNLEEGETKNSAKKIIESISFLSNGKE
ncbi:lipoprotein YvcA [Niallia taxi]|uniref:lipoprotein YvcA n=1 Tax=Niallia taxi TaxID=2499688 RepID=UPI002E1C0144|nr:lipoprotein YvcA [Niallia taxi]MED4122270.1 lipoprotein YvcA [Niallia taxi]